MTYSLPVGFLVLLRPCVTQTDQTDLTILLNDAIGESDPGAKAYSGGKGLIVRNPYDGYEDSAIKAVVPGTFWHNDIRAPSQVFPSSEGAGDGWDFTSFNVDCPNDGWNGFSNLSPCMTDPGNSDEVSPWNYAGTGYILSPEGMGNLFPEWDNVQHDDWGWHVFYPTDSNSVDYRCIWLETYQGWDCGPDMWNYPNGAWKGGWIPLNGDWVEDNTKLGSGNYEAGNPAAFSGKGGGAGCHFDKLAVDDGMGLDQTDGSTDDGHGLVMDYNCQCDYIFSDNWEHWVQVWIATATPKPQTAWENWLGGSGIKAPNRALDMASCWVNNPRDLIGLQNAFYKFREDWSNQLAPKSNWDTANPQSLRYYWGWNEIPVDRTKVSKSSNHAAIFVKLPAAICGGMGGDDSIACLSAGGKLALQRDLWKYIHDGKILPGKAMLGKHPGSDVVVVREWYDNSEDWWRRWIFCEDWWSPDGKLHIAFQVDGTCYIEVVKSDEQATV